jgi:hypothetical protein
VGEFGPPPSQTIDSNKTISVCILVRSQMMCVATAIIEVQVAVQEEKRLTDADPSARKM